MRKKRQQLDFVLHPPTQSLTHTLTHWVEVTMDLKGGLLLKRKDYLGVDEEAGSHPNRTYYFKKNSDDLNKTIAACSQTLRVRVQCSVM